MSEEKYGGYMEFTYDVKTTSGKQNRFVRIDLGTITKVDIGLSKSGTPNALVSMGVRHNIYIDSTNTRTISVNFTRITPSRSSAEEPGAPPQTFELSRGEDTEYPFFWTKDGAIVCLDQQQVKPNMSFTGASNQNWKTDGDAMSNEVFNSSKLWSNAYWIKGFNKINDRWQMKFDGADFVYWPKDDLTDYISEEIRYHVYTSTLDWKIEAGAPEVLKGSLTMTVGRNLRNTCEGAQ